MLPHFYALLCDAERIKKRLEEGTDPNIRDGDGNTPLHFAASKGCAEVARLLLRHGADPNAQDKSGETPLHIAASKGHVDVMRLLLEHGADPSIRNRDGKTPLDLAEERGHREVASLIEEWLGQRKRPSRPGAVPVRSVSDAVCETYCEAWRIINQVYDFVGEGHVMTSKEFEDLEKLFYIFKGHVEALETMITRPDVVKELINIRDYIELLLPHLMRGGLPADALPKITSMRHRINNLKQQLACRC